MAEFQWERAQAALNRFPQFLTTIDSFKIHFYHVRSKSPRMPQGKPVGPVTTAKLWHQRMTQVLAYTRYGDWGNAVSTQLARQFPKLSLGLHLNGANQPHSDPAGPRLAWHLIEESSAHQLDDLPGYRLGGHRSMVLSRQVEDGPGASGKVTIPTAFATFPKEMPPLSPPRSALERGFHLVRYTKMPRGGHFAALEQPELFDDDVSAFFSELRP
ncbi:MAG: epoxide hydrolase N-terminal domain-containing protein [Acidobacteriota bacterium]